MVEITNSLLFTGADIAALANQILEMDPDPVPRYRILRDILHVSPNDATLQEAERKMKKCRWASKLGESQLSDGSWGRFHTQDASIKSPFPTSEFAILRALALGLDRHSPTLQKASEYIQGCLLGKTTWSDRIEKGDHPGLWAINTRSISAAMLAFIEGDHPLLEPVQHYWIETIQEAFKGGNYDRGAELAKQQQMTGVPSQHFYAFHAYYPLIILSSKPGVLEPGLEQQVLEYVLHRQEGIYYVYGKCLDAFPRIEEKGFMGWLRAMEILGRFAGWGAFAPEPLNWLWDQRGANGLWDPGKKIPPSYFFPLSESWRRESARVIDFSVRVLCLLGAKMPT